MTEVEPRPAGSVADGSPGPPQRVPLTAKLLLHDSLTARRAAAIIAVFTVAITIVGGILERLADHKEFPTIGKGLWFALQTVTTVGYGDVTPNSRRRFAAQSELDAVRQLDQISERLASIEATLDRQPSGS